MRTFAALALVLSAACSSALWRADGSRVTSTVALPVDSVLRVAATQLEHHGFEVHNLGGGVLITMPRPVPSHAGTGAADAREAENWIVRVSAEPLSFVRGSRMQVSAYTLPPGATLATDEQLQQDAVQVTTVRNARLFREVEAVAGWINDAAQRRRSGQ